MFLPARIRWKKRKRNFFKTLQSGHFWRRQFPVLIGSRCKRMCSKPWWRHIYLKNCVIITHCFFEACSILYYFLFWKGTHTFSNENHRDTWGWGLNHDSPVCVCMSFRSDLVWKTLNGENWTKSLFFPSSKKLSITCAKHCRFRYTVWPVMLGDIGLIAE